MGGTGTGPPRLESNRRVMGYYRYYGYYLPWFFLASSSGGLTVRSSASHARHPPRTILMTLRPTSEPPTLVPTNGPSQFPTLVPTSAPEPPVTVSAGGAYTAQHAARPDRRNSATWRYVARGASAHRRRSRCAGDSARCSSVLCTSNLTHSRGPIVWNARARCSCVAKAAHAPLLRL